MSVRHSMQRTISIEHPDVLGLGFGDLPYDPHQVHIVGLTRLIAKPKAHLPGQLVALTIVTGRTTRYDVLPAIVPTSG